MKIIKWDEKLKKFEMDRWEEADLRENHLKDQFTEFAKIYNEFDASIHPKERSSNLCIALLLWSTASVILFWVFYAFFIIFQLALYNFIMGVVMFIFWWRLCQVTMSIIKRYLDNQKKKLYRAYFNEVRSRALLKSLSIEIQEHEEGKWIEIHLNETADDKESDDDDDEPQ